MKKKAFRFLSTALCLPLLAGAIAFLPTATTAKASSYYKGVDISWLPAMESSSYTFKNSSGTTQNCVTILDNLSVTAVRIRLFVNPSTNAYTGRCGEAADIALAKRAVAAGWKVMLDFHYSDTFADPSTQTLPSAWSSCTTISALKTKVYNYTYAVMKDFINAGVTPTWVQMGNETTNGLLWPLGKATTSFSNVAGIFNSAYSAVKAANSSTKCIIHLANGQKTSLFTWFFAGIAKYSANYDIVGMSVYPTASTYSSYCSSALTTMKTMKSTYSKYSMICECGFAANDPTNGSKFMKLLATDVKSAGALGIFYWEPQAYSWNGYGLAAWDYSTKKPTAVMSAY